MSTGERIRQSDGAFAVALVRKLLVTTLVMFAGMPAFNAVYERAADVSTMNDLRTAQLTAREYLVEHGSFVGASADALRAMAPSLPGDDRLRVVSNAAGFAIEVDSPRRAEFASFAVRGTPDGATVRECRDDGDGDSGFCDHGAW